MVLERIKMQFINEVVCTAYFGFLASVTCLSLLSIISSESIFGGAPQDCQFSFYLLSVNFRIAFNAFPMIMEGNSFHQRCYLGVRPSGRPTTTDRLLLHRCFFCAFLRRVAFHSFRLRRPAKRPGTDKWRSGRAFPLCTTPVCTLRDEGTTRRYKG